jgi:hypothetical protein
VIFDVSMRVSMLCVVFLVVDCDVEGFEVVVGVDFFVVFLALVVLNRCRVA